MRTVALRPAFTSATAVAARLGTAEVGAHQIAFEIWIALALALDAIAIAGQALVGRLLGAGDPLRVLHHAVTALHDPYGPYIDGLEERLAVVEQEMVGEPRDAHLVEIAAIRRQADWLRRTLTPGRDTAARTTIVMSLPGASDENPSALPPSSTARPGRRSCLLQGRRPRVCSVCTSASAGGSRASRYEMARECNDRGRRPSGPRRHIRGPICTDSRTTAPARGRMVMVLPWLWVLVPFSYGLYQLMIKIPATATGVPAIEQLTADGVNVNVTLLFSVARYEHVIDAYLKGLERRMSTGQPLHEITSVASFFVSRVDTKASQVLDGTSPLRNRVAVANAHRAYQRYRARFGDERWAALEREGARPQRPLWASTGTKDPNASDVLYVEQLIARDVINTMPLATLAAFADHGEVADAIDLDAHDADRVLHDAAVAGVDLPAITDDLEHEGVGTFRDSYRELLSCIDAKLADATVPVTEPEAAA